MLRLTTVTKYLIIANVLVFIATLGLGFATGIGLDPALQIMGNLFGLNYIGSPRFAIYQFITYMFIHGGFTHIIFNMFTLWMFGCVVENALGPKRFLFYYIICGIGAGLCQELCQYLGIEGIGPCVGASGAIYGVLLAFGMLYPNERMFIIPIPIPIKGKWMIWIFIALEFFTQLTYGGTDGVAHFAHLGGMLFGFLLIKYWQNHPYSGSGDFGIGKGSQFFNRMKDSWERHNSHSSNGGGTKFHYRPNTENTSRESDWDYNARKKAEQEEVDRILDKIRRSGYDSLTDNEKRKLFDQSKK